MKNINNKLNKLIHLLTDIRTTQNVLKHNHLLIERTLERLEPKIIGMEKEIDLYILTLSKRKNNVKKINSS